MRDNELIGQFIDAAVLDQVKAAQMLRERPELRDARWIHEESIVDFLTIEGYVDGVKWLLKNGFDVNVRDKFGDTALIHAIQLENLEIARLLVDAGADCSVVSPTLGDLIEIASVGAREDVMEFVSKITQR